MKSSKKINIFLIILPVIIYLITVFLITDIIFSHKADSNFIYKNGIISGARGFSDKYLSHKYFKEYDPSLSNRLINKSNALQQVHDISNSRAYSNEDVNTLFQLIDSFTSISDRSINNEKVIDIMNLNIALDEIKH